MDGNTTGRLVPALPDHRNLNRNDGTAGLSQAADELLPNRLSPQHMDKVQAERFRSFEGLLRKHLKFTKYATMQPHTHAGTLGVQRALIVRRLAARLEQHGDVMASILLRTALNVAESSTEGNVMAVMNDFLRFGWPSALSATI